MSLDGGSWGLWMDGGMQALILHPVHLCEQEALTSRGRGCGGLGLTAGGRILAGFPPKGARRVGRGCEGKVQLAEASGAACVWGGAGGLGDRIRNPEQRQVSCAPEPGPPPPENPVLP